jgi:hypothetical protein
MNRLCRSTCCTATEFRACLAPNALVRAQHGLFLQGEAYV